MLLNAGCTAFGIALFLAVGVPVDLVLELNSVVLEEVLVSIGQTLVVPHLVHDQLLVD